MRYTCTSKTDLDELIGMECDENRQLAFHYGPLPIAMKGGEELVLENSWRLSPALRAKLLLLLRSLFIEETNEVIQPGPGFRLTYQ